MTSSKSFFYQECSHLINQRPTVSTSLRSNHNSWWRRLASLAQMSLAALAGVFCLQLIAPHSVAAQSAMFSPGLSAAATPFGGGTPVLQIAQSASVPSPGVLPTDVTPLSLGGEREASMREFRYKFLRKLPERFWFNLTTEVSQRLDTNVLMTYSNPRADYTFRVLPNISLGWNVAKRTSFYCNYFLIKDVYATHSVLTFPTTMSLAMGMRHDMPLGRRANAQFDMQARELWQTTNLRQADLIPAVNLSYTLTPRVFLFSSVLLQMRSRNLFEGPTRELDPFYSVGAMLRRGNWNFLATNTFVTNFRDPPFRGSIPTQGNVSMISDFEVNHPITHKVPGLVAFLRAEPVFNWRSNRVVGISGFDFRFFGGLRLSASKDAYTADIESLKEQLKKQEQQKQSEQPTQDAPKNQPLP